MLFEQNDAFQFTVSVRSHCPLPMQLKVTSSFGVFNKCLKASTFTKYMSQVQSTKDYACKHAEVNGISLQEWQYLTDRNSVQIIKH